MDLCICACVFAIVYLYLCICACVFVLVYLYLCICTCVFVLVYLHLCICTILIVVRWQPSGGAFVHCGGGQEQVGPEQGQASQK